MFTKTKSTQRKQTRAFTLIEILVVIGVLALLAGAVYGLCAMANVYIRRAGHSHSRTLENVIGWGSDEQNSTAVVSSGNGSRPNTLSIQRPIPVDSTSSLLTGRESYEWARGVGGR